MDMLTPSPTFLRQMECSSAYAPWARSLGITTRYSFRSHNHIEPRQYMARKSRSTSGAIVLFRQERSPHSMSVETTSLVSQIEAPSQLVGLQVQKSNLQHPRLYKCKRDIKSCPKNHLTSRFERKMLQHSIYLPTLSQPQPILSVILL